MAAFDPEASRSPVKRPRRVLNGEKWPLPAVPIGHTPSTFGKQIMRWQSGSRAAQHRIITLTNAELVQQGVTPAIARAWRDFYINEATRNPRNPSAPGRIALMAWAVNLLLSASQVPVAHAIGQMVTITGEACL